VPENLAVMAGIREVELVPGAHLSGPSGCQFLMALSHGIRGVTSFQATAVMITICS
jgi:hypothetical protein